MMQIKENVPLKGLNSFGVDAVARYFVELEGIDDIQELIKTEVFKTQKRFIIGGGSNLLFTEDFDGLLIKMNNRGIELKENKNNEVKATVAAGESWDDFVQFCVMNKIGGLENLSLIPGNVGAAPIQNIGAYGVEQQDSFYELKAFDLEKGKVRKFNKKECGFAYRGSVFKTKYPGRFLVLEVTYLLSKEHRLNLNYAALKIELQSRKIGPVTIQVVANTISQIRKSKLPDPEVLGNAGSFFKNPIISRDHFLDLKTKYPDLVAYKINDRCYKLPAAWVIERAGWKGRKVGQVGVHDQQALVIVNFGGSSGKEIFDLSEKIRDDVLDDFSVSLEREVIVL
jgi:UDP-N-acetylmuramate dehydrogenase